MSWISELNFIEAINEGFKKMKITILSDKTLSKKNKEIKIN